MKIAVVGSGIAGLSAAWKLSQHHEVTLYEKFGHLGMDTHSLEIKGDQGSARIDVPLRVFFNGFYPNLTALYEKLNIEFEPVNYSASFGTLHGKTYFRYDNYKFGRYLVPFFKGGKTFNRKALQIGWDALRLFRHSPGSIENGIDDNTTLEDYLERHNYSKTFTEGFLYPAFSGICTCSHESIKAYPARVVLEYLNSNLLFSSVRRVTHGTQEVVDRLTQGVYDIKLNSQVTSVYKSDDGIAVRTSNESATYDHVVLATQANQTARILENASPAEQKLLASFSYEPSRVIVHKDSRLAPPGGKAHWAPVNFLLSNGQTAPMATIWMNAIQTMPDSDPVFQTWNPIIEPDRSLVIGEAEFERPVVNRESMRGLEHLALLHQQPDRRIWFCGSYASHGIPLLESATNPAFSIAERLAGLRASTAQG